MPWSVGAAAIGGAASALGVSKANTAQRRMAREQMAFQERMSSTAYQRAMADMRKAGLNPMLAFQQGGASSLPGAQATQSDIGSPAVHSALQAHKAKEELQLLKDQQQETRARTNKEAAESQVGFHRAHILRKHIELGMPEVEVNSARAMQRIHELQIPGLQNIANFQRGQYGATQTQLQLWRQSLFGGGMYQLPR